MLTIISTFPSFIFNSFALGGKARAWEAETREDGDRRILEEEQ